MQPKLVVNKMLTDWDVYIGRPTIWGNPFRIGVGPGYSGTRDECVVLFEALVKESPGFRLKVKEFLPGKRLGCFCAGPLGLDENDPIVCHGQILLKILRGDYDEKKESE